MVELTWRRLGDQAVLLALTRNGQRWPQTSQDAGRGFRETAIREALQRLASEVKVASIEELNAYDSYYYPPPDIIKV